MATEKLPALKEGIIAHLKNAKKLSEKSDGMKLLNLIQAWENGNPTERTVAFKKIYDSFGKRCTILTWVGKENQLRTCMNEIIAVLKEIEYELPLPVKAIDTMSKLEQDVFHDADQASDIYPPSYLEMIFPYKTFKDPATQ